MAKLHVAQIEYLSQQLIDQIKNANNLIVRSKVEIDHAQRTLRILLAALRTLLMIHCAAELRD
ncbi:MAG TPA: hypothetical protein VMW10_05905 [Alphaproteobacteria bacterium]|nr:hypothetical protein [Alphaproteobacteria bacterium]